MNGELNQKRLSAMVTNILSEGGKRLIVVEGPVVYYLDPNEGEMGSYITIQMTSMLLRYEVDLTRLMKENGLDVECEAYNEIAKEIAEYYMKQDCDIVFYYEVETFLAPMMLDMAAKFKFRGACYKSKGRE